jgi:hypothetical protein
MRRMRPLVLLVCIALLTAASNEPGSDPTWAMRLRTWCDTPAGYAFRYPYDWRMPGMYDNALDRKSGAHGTVPSEKREFKMQGQTVVSSSPTRPPRDDDLAHDVIAFSLADPGGELDALGDKQAKIALEWKDFDYYRSDPARPHADPRNGAPGGVVARLGIAADRCALIMRYNSRVSGVVCAGMADEAATKALIDSFELLPGPPEKGKKAVTGTWRERQARAGKVFNAQGNLVAATVKTKPVAWTEGWDIETEHYHISAHTNPGRLIQHGAYYEALYRSYCEVYLPEKMPPVKFEVHVFDKAKDFLAASAAWGIPVSMGGGSIVGGFFVPSLLSLWVYEESGALGGDDFTVEHVSAHECSHQFLHVACNGSDHVPTWINEGLAVYFESGKFKGGQFVIMPPVERLERLVTFYSRDNAMLQKPEQYLDHKGHIGADQYGEVYAMVHFWVFNQCRTATCKHREKDNCGRYRFLQFWAAMRKGEEGKDAFERIYMETMVKTLGSREKAVKEWEKQMVDYVKKNKKWKVD